MLRALLRYARSCRWLAASGRRMAFVESQSFCSGLGNSGWLLYGIVRNLRPQVCVEIGSAQGRSACFIGMGLKDNGQGTLGAIDPHTRTDWNDTRSVDTLDVMVANLRRAGVQDYVTVLHMTSQDAAREWSRPIDVLFIDGDHSYEGVKGDWVLFSPWVKETGVVVFHDTMWDRSGASAPPAMGVPRFVEELRCHGYPVITLQGDCGVSIVQPAIGGMPLTRPSGRHDRS